MAGRVGGTCGYGGGCCSGQRGVEASAPEGCERMVTERVSWLWWVGLVLLGGVGVSVGGCASTAERSYAVDLPAGVARVGVDVENFAGDVVVRAVRGVEPRLDAFVTVAGGVDEDRESAMREAVGVSMVVEEAAPGLATVRVRSESRLAGEGMHDVRLELVVPRADGVRVVNRGGLVELIDVGGRLEIENASGPVLVRTSRALVDPVRVLAVDGDVFVQVPDGSTGALRLESLEGEVRVKDSFGRTSETEGGGSLMRTRLAGGVNEVDLRTSRGVVEYLVMEDPVGYARAVTARPFDARDWFGRDSSRRYLDNRPDDDLPDPLGIGDGSYYGSPPESNSYQR